MPITARMICLRLMRHDDAMRERAQCLRFVRRCHGAEKAPTIKGRGKLAEQITEKPRSSALSALLHRVEPNASCLHPSFNYSQSAFFGQGPCPRPATCSFEPKSCSFKPMAYTAQSQQAVILTGRGPDGVSNRF